MSRWAPLLPSLGTPTAAHAADPLLFVYFKEPANMGVFFAISNDGYRFRPLNGGKPWFGIEHAGALIRDPFLTRGSTPRHAAACPVGQVPDLPTGRSPAT